MTYSITTVTPPPLPPVDLCDTKAHLVVEHSSDDVLIAGLMNAAGAWVANYLNGDVVKTVLKMQIDAFPSCIELPRGPVREVTSITYLDTDNTEQTLAADQYEVDFYKGEIYPAYNVTWPDTLTHRNAVSVTYGSGYYTQGATDLLADIPADIKAACLLIVGDLYEHRERQQDIQLYSNDAVSMLLSPYRYIPI